MLKKETSCGAIVIENGKVLLVHQTNGLWSFPKGHIEPGETEVETAIREVKEETALDVVVDPSKQFKLEYIIESLKIDKTVILFFARLSGKNTISSQEGEIEETRWVPIPEVDSLLMYERWHEVWGEILAEIKLRGLV